jgi:formate dehydrogenase maturation protein FdhE
MGHVNGMVRALHLPLARLALCLDCEATFEIRIASCPACASRTWVPVARFLHREADDWFLARFPTSDGAVEASSSPAS